VAELKRIKSAYGASSVAPVQPEAVTNIASSAQPLTQRREFNKRRALIELALGYGVILLVIWTPAPWQRPLYLVAVLVVAAILWMGFTSASPMGLRAANFRAPSGSSPSPWLSHPSASFQRATSKRCTPCPAPSHSSNATGDTPSGPSSNSFCCKTSSLAASAVSSTAHISPRWLRRPSSPSRTCPIPSSPASPSSWDWPRACSSFTFETSTHWPWHTPSSASPSPSRYPALSYAICAWALATSPSRGTISITATTATTSYPPAHGSVPTRPSHCIRSTPTCTQHTDVPATQTAQSPSRPHTSPRPPATPPASSPARCSTTTES
jgi:hypothetical protein